MPSQETIESALKGDSYKSYLVYRQRAMTRGLLVAGVVAMCIMKGIAELTSNAAFGYPSALVFAAMLVLTWLGWTAQRSDVIRLSVCAYLTVLLFSLLSEAWNQPYWLAATAPVLLIVPIASAFVWFDVVDFVYAMLTTISSMVIVVLRSTSPPQINLYMGSYMALSIGLAVMLHIIIGMQRKQYYDMERRLSHGAFVDELTGLWNRRYVLKMARKLCEQANTIISPMCILYIDADHFKHINDEHGHEAGDDILRTLAQRISACLRKEDVLGRIGGEEFVAVLPQTRREDALRIARRICDEARTLTVNGITTTVSIGIAHHHTGADLRSTLNRADAAVLMAKRRGRNQIYISMDEQGSKPR